MHIPVCDSRSVDAWAALYGTWLLIKLTPKGIVFSSLFYISFLFCSVFADKGMHVLQLGNGETEIGSVYDIASQTFTPFHFSTNAFCAGHSVAEDGTVIIAGKQPPRVFSLPSL